MAHPLDIHDLKVDELIEKLAFRLKAMGDRESLSIVEDIQLLKRAQKLLSTGSFYIKLGESIPPVDPVVGPNGSFVAQTQINGNGQLDIAHYQPTRSKADVAIEIIRKAGRPLHIKDIIANLPAYGITVKKNTLTTLLSKDRRRRFKRVAPNTFTIDEAAVAATIEARFESFRGGLSRLLPEGFSLIGSIKKLASEMEGEFSQPVMVNVLREHYPDIADRIQPASVSQMLGVLLSRGYIDITFEGKGPMPRRYKRTEKLVAEMRQPRMAASNEELALKT